MRHSKENCKDVVESARESQFLGQTLKHRHLHIRGERQEEDIPDKRSNINSDLHSEKSIFQMWMFGSLRAY